MPIRRIIQNIKSHLYGYKDGIEWLLVNSVLSNFPSISVRNFGLRMLGVKMNKEVHFYQGFHIRTPRSIHISPGTSIGPKVLLDGRRGLKIGKNVVIAYEAIIWTLNHDYNDVYFAAKGAPVEIGDYAWICCRAIILPGVKIGEGAVVAAGSIVTKDVPPFTVVAGVPAKIVAQREHKAYQYGYNSTDSFAHFV